MTSTVSIYFEDFHGKTFVPTEQRNNNLLEGEEITHIVSVQFQNLAF